MDFKKKLAVALSAATVLMSSVPVISASAADINLDYEYLMGDINGDGSVTVADMVEVSNHLSGKTTLTAEQMVVADLNNDRSINIFDQILIKRTVLGIKGEDWVSPPVSPTEPTELPTDAPTEPTDAPVTTVVTDVTEATTTTTHVTVTMPAIVTDVTEAPTTVVTDVTEAPTTTIEVAPVTTIVTDVTEETTTVVTDVTEVETTVVTDITEVPTTTIEVAPVTTIATDVTEETTAIVTDVTEVETTIATEVTTEDITTEVTTVETEPVTTEVTTTETETLAFPYEFKIDPENTGAVESIVFTVNAEEGVVYSGAVQFFVNGENVDVEYSNADSVDGVITVAVPEEIEDASKIDTIKICKYWQTEDTEEATLSNVKAVIDGVEVDSYEEPAKTADSEAVMMGQLGTNSLWSAEDLAEGSVIPAVTEDGTYTAKLVLNEATGSVEFLIVALDGLSSEDFADLAITVDAIMVDGVALETADLDAAVVNTKYMEGSFNGTRIYIVDSWTGSGAAAIPADTAITESIEITFTVSGING